MAEKFLEITLPQLNEAVKRCYKAMFNEDIFNEHDDDEYEYDDWRDDWYCTADDKFWINGETGAIIKKDEPHDKGIQISVYSSDFSDIDYGVSPKDPDVGYNGDIWVEKCTCESYEWEVYDEDPYWAANDIDTDAIVEKWVTEHDADIKQILEEVAEPEYRY